ncbi:hypothetical protein [Nocardia noduli]|uniref:hypothetical protein n=1 Tax=Nocardia noduli TaxID=2815722 RepID=UPI001C23BE8A|nr:hypothetical protein [Nocardia noduli]
MSAVVDHSLLTAIAETPIYGQVLLDDFRNQHRILVIAPTSLMAAAAMSGNAGANLATLFERPATVKFTVMDARAALSVRTRVAYDPGPDWPLVAPVVAAALDHDLPVLTRLPELYRSHRHIQVIPAP